MTEAPPPCEKCSPYMEPRMDVVPAVIRARYTGDLVIHAQRLHHEIAELRAAIQRLKDAQNHVPCHAALLQLTERKDTEIAELRARIKGMAVKYERQSKMNGSLSLVGAVRVAKELRAALAPKEGK